MPRRTHRPGDREQEQNEQEQREKQVRQLERELQAEWQQAHPDTEGMTPDAAQEEAEGGEQA